MTKKKGKSESNVANSVRLQTSQACGVVLFRNNVGAFETATGAWVRYGLANESKEMNKRIKSSDFIGWMPVVVTAEMVGYTLPVFTAIETKEEGYKPSGKKQLDHVAAQQKYCDLVINAGGIAGIVDSAEKAVQLVKNWLNKFDA